MRTRPIHEVRGVPCLLLAACCIAASGCITTPRNQDILSTSVEQTFSGFSDLPSDNIQLQALNKGNNAWETIATTKSDDKYPVSLGGLTLYYWEVKVRLRSKPHWECYLFSICQLTEGHPTVRVRAHSVTNRGWASTLDFFAYEQGDALSCTTGAVQNGTPWLTAYEDCGNDPYDKTLELIAY